MDLIRRIQLSQNDIDTLLQRCEDGELTTEMVADTIEAIEGEIGVKCDSIADIIAENDGDIATLKHEVTRLRARIERLEASNSRLKSGLMWYLKYKKSPKLKTPLHSFRVCKDGGKTPIAYTAAVPKEYCTFTPKPNGEAIRKALERGETLEFACFKERGEHLKID